MKSVLLVANPNHEEAVASMEKLAAGLNVVAEVAGKVTEFDSDLSSYEVDGIVAFGGDGTILNIARRRGQNQVPVLGVNLGRLGYLAEFSLEEMDEGVAELLGGNASISPRMMLDCKVNAGGKVSKFLALNDIVVSSTLMGRTGEVTVFVDDRPLTTLVGDGVIVSTPTGSTAYSMSAGGPILAPELRSMVLTPVCPHELANRPLVISDRERVRLTATERSGPVRLAADGHAELYEEEHLEVEVCASDTVFPLGQRKGSGRYEILRQKLGWGGCR